MRDKIVPVTDFRKVPRKFIVIGNTKSKDLVVSTEFFYNSIQFNFLSFVKLCYTSLLTVTLTGGDSTTKTLSSLTSGGTWLRY